MGNGDALWRRTDGPDTTLLAMTGIDVADATTERLLHAKFFAVPAGARRDRRPTDVTMLVMTAVVLAVFATRVDKPLGALEAAINNLIAALPSALRPVWAIAHDLLIVWAALVVLITLLRRQWGLARDLATGAAAVLAMAMLVGRLANDTWPKLLGDLLRNDGAATYPAAGLALWISISSIASSHLSRPYRYLGRWIMWLGVLGSLGLGVTTPSGSLGAGALGLGMAAAIHLTFGSPGGIPSFTQVEAALSGIGIRATVDEVVRRGGVVRVRVTDANGNDLDVKLFGRDAWDGQLLVTLWRFLWYRESGKTLALTRLQQVEHEAFLTLLAERRGASVSSVVAAGEDSIGDALLVLHRQGAPLAEIEGPIDEALCASMWQMLSALHHARITHGALDAERVFLDGQTVRFADFSAGEIESSPHSFLADRAQLVATTALRFGTEPAVAAAHTALGSEGLADVSAYLQQAAMSTRLRRDLKEADFDLDELRKSAITVSGAEPRDLQRIHRLSIGRVLLAVLLFVAGSTLITGLLEIGFDTIVDAIREASLPIVVLAYLISLLSRPSNAYSLSALSPVKVPFGRLVVLQFAMNFINVAVPSTAGRVATNIRFFQRNGVEPATAVALGAIDGFTGFIAQMFLMGSILLLGIGSFNLNLETDFSTDGLGSILVVLGIILAAATIAIITVPVLRKWVLDAFTALRNFLGPLLRSPRRMVRALAGNCGSEMIGALVLYTVLAAFGQSVNLFDVVLVSIGVGLFAGLMPVPGGIGVAEAALTTGFISLGVDSATAFAAALTCRMVTFYIPPLPGWFALRWLQRQKFL